MKISKISLKTIALTLILTLVVGSMPLWSMTTVKAADPVSTDTLNESMEYLVNECGPRLAASPNEDKAAKYINDKLEAYGYDVSWDKISQPAARTGRVVYDGDIQDSYGNAYPNNVATFGSITGDVVEFGTYGDIDIPEDAGDVIGTVKVTTTAAAGVGEQINNVYTSAASVDGTDLKGLVFTRDESIGTEKQRAQTPTMSRGRTTSYALGLTDLAYEKVLDEADSLDHMEIFMRTDYNNVIATKPAKSGNPDTILVVSSHMDSVMNSPGASDNGSGTAALLELAKRYADKDMGNIELRFAVFGSEESGLKGSRHYVKTLSNEEKSIMLNMNMDMLCADTKTADGVDLNAVSMDIHNLPAKGLNWSAHAVVSESEKVDWAEGIENVRVFNYGSSDHQAFSEAGVEAASMIVATDADDDIENVNHTALDTLEYNYSYDRLKMCTQMIDNGIQKIADVQLCKKADFAAKDGLSYATLNLTNHKSVFSGDQYDKVIFDTVPHGYDDVKTISINKNKPFASGMALFNLEVSNVKGIFSGVADVKNASRQAQYGTGTASLATTVVDAYNYNVDAEAEKGGTVTGGKDYNKNSAATVKAYASDGYRFVGWYNKTTGEKVSTNWQHSFKVTEDAALVAKFAKIPKISIKVKAAKGKKAKISWKKVTGAHEYRVYRATKKNGTYKRIATVKASDNKTSFVNKKRKAGKKYYYKVRVVAKSYAYTSGPLSNAKVAKFKK